MSSGASRAPWARWLIRAVVSGVVIAILLAIVPLGAVVDALARVSAWTWAASVAIFFAGHYLNAIKLRLLLGPGVISGGNYARPRFSSCLRAQYAGLVANLGLPGLAGGDVVRALYLAPSVGLARVTVASVVDRLIDTLVLVAMISIALPIAGIPPAIADVFEQAWGQAWLWVAVAVPIALAGLFVAVRLVRKPAVASKLRGMRSAFSARPPAVIAAAAISLGVQSAFVMTNVWLARQVGVTTVLAAWFVAWPLSKLISILPLSLGGIGVREAALVSLLVPYGAAADAVLASGILWQSVLMVTGLIGLAVTQLLPQAPGAAPVPNGARGI